MARSRKRILAGYVWGARLLGVPFEEYRAHRDAKERWCWRCQAWRPEGEFYINKHGKRAGKVDTHKCRICTREVAEAFKAGYLAEHGVPYIPKAQREAAHERS